MDNYIELGPTPYDEDCAQVGSENFRKIATRECRAYVNQLCRQWPTARISVKWFNHGFGSYPDVIVRCDDSDFEQAFEIEDNLPSNWDDQARMELGLRVELSPECPD